MSLLTARRALPATDRPPLVARDSAVDVARAACLVIVVALHAMMVGVSAPDGAPVFENAMSMWDGFAATTWVVQVMPLFFVLGGFSSFADWTRRRAGGERAGTYIVGRVRRLTIPALAALVATGVFLAILTIVGVDPAVVAEAGFRISQPLWFLAVYLLCTLLVPIAVACHERAPALTVGLLAAAVLAVDLTRIATGVEAVGLANLLFVWMLVQQLGYFVADGRLSSLGRGRILRLGSAALAVLALTTSAGLYSADLFDALNPPTGALVLLGVVQLCAFELLRPRLRAWHARAPIARATRAVGAHAMTVYAWHMLVLLALAGVLLLLPIDLPAPVSADWWASRPLWLVAAGVATAVVARAAGVFERRPSRTSRRTGWAAFGIAAVSALGIVVILAGTGSLAAWIIGAALVGFGVYAARAGGRRANGRRAPGAVTSSRVIAAGARASRDG
ncbi:acyltransferase family protein [Microbacterium sp. NPDC055357]